MTQSPSPLTQQVTNDLRRILAGDPSVATLNHALRHLSKWRAHLIENTVVNKAGDKILSGPFKGMSYATRASEGARVPRLLGCYEATLAPIIEDIVQRAYPLVIDVGCAEGYYAVGLARRMQNSRIMARDTDPAAQSLCADLARQNDVADRIEIGGTFQGADFDICGDQKTLVICDIEGAEGELLNPDVAPGLLRADILVEVHEGMRPGLTDTLKSRFSETHKIVRLGRMIDGAALPKWMEEFSDLDRLLALWEWRASPTPWLWMTRNG